VQAVFRGEKEKRATTESVSGCKGGREKT